MDRFAFWWHAMKRGVNPLNSAAGVLGMVVVVLGIAAGITVPLVFHVSHWITAVILMGILVVIVLEGSYQVWRETDERRKAAEAQARSTSSPAITVIGGTGGQGGGGGGGAAGPSGIAQGGKGGESNSLLEVFAYSSLVTGLSVREIAVQQGYSPDDPRLRLHGGGGGGGGAVSGPGPDEGT